MRAHKLNAHGKRLNALLLTTLTAIGVTTAAIATQASTPAADAQPTVSGSIDSFLKATGEPQPHRIPGHYFTSPGVPAAQEAAAPRVIVGPSTPIVEGDMACTIAVSGYDRHGNKVALTAGHCGGPGTSVKSFDAMASPAIGVIDHIVAGDIAVIRLRNDIILSRNYGNVTINELGGRPRDFSILCKTGITTGTTCGPTLHNAGSTIFAHLCGSFGDSGAPISQNQRLIGILNGGIAGLPSCKTPIQGPFHAPTVGTTWSHIQRSLDAHGGVGAGFRLP